MSRIHVNNFGTLTNGSILASDSSIVLVDAAGFPAIGSGVTCNLTLQSGATIEIVTATAISGSTITVTRGSEGTTPVAWPSGSVIGIRPTADSVDRKEDLIGGRTFSDVGAPAAGDKILLQDASDSSKLKVAQFSTFGGGGGSLSDGDYGDVTVSGSGTAITIDADAVTYSKIQNVSATDKILGRSTAGAGDVEEITCTAAGRALIDDADASAQRTTLGLGTLSTQSGTFSGTSSGTNTGDQTITLTGDVTGSGTGSFAATIANGAVTLTKQADMATASLVYRKTAGSGAPEVNSLATLKTDLGLTGTNSGDQTSIVGITGTKAQFDTACTDGDFLYSGDVTQYTDEMAQDATGAMVDSTIVYTDATPLLSRAALTGDVTASAGSNATTIANNAVTLAKMAQMSTASILGRNTASTGNVEVLSAATTKSLLSLNNVENTALSTWAGSSNITTLGTIGTGTWNGTTIATSKGGTGVTSVTTTPTASSFAGWDANKNISVNNMLEASTSTVTAAGTTTLTVASTYYQRFTGSSTQTCVLPAVSTLALGTSYVITNLSSGVVTVQSSGANTVQAMQTNSTLTVTSNTTVGTGATVWDIASYVPAASSQTGSGSLVRATSPTIAAPSINQLNDTNGNEILGLSAIASAVNYVTIENNTAGNPVSFKSAGSDTDISINFFPKGAGSTTFLTTSNSPLNLFSGTGYQHISAFTFPNTSATRVRAFADASGTILMTGTTNTMGASDNIILGKATATEAANAVTASAQAGIITTSSLTTAAGSNYTITWTNTFISSTSVINLTVMGGTNTVNNIYLKVTNGSGSSTITIYNIHASSALNGTLKLGFIVV